VSSQSLFFAFPPKNIKWLKSSLSSLLFIVSLFASFCSFSAKSVDIHTVEELVVNQSDEVRSAAAARALATVFVRLSGSQSVLEASGVRTAIAKASIYISEFGYQQTDQVITIAGATQAANRLVMRFSQAPLEAILKNNQLPIWLSDRPDVLVWGALNRDGKSYMSADSLMALALKKSASQRGLPITSPVLDLNDRASLPVSRLWALDEDAVLAASSRYETDAVLAGRFAESAGQWTGNMLLLHRGKTNYFSATAATQAEVARSVIDQVTDYLASIYAVAPNLSGDRRSVMLQIDNISDFNYYAGVVAYLESLPLLESLDVESVHGNQLIVKAHLNSSIERLINTFNLDKKLTLVDSAELSDLQTEVVTSGPKNLYQFIWQE
jgi:hypothetical protein